MIIIFQQNHHESIEMLIQSEGKETILFVKISKRRWNKVFFFLLKFQQVLHQTTGGQKMSVVSAAQQRAAAAAAATLMKQGIAAGGTVAQTAVGKQTVTRTVSETEMAALIKRQALQQQAKAAAAAAAVAQVQVSERACLAMINNAIVCDAELIMI